MSRLTTYLRQRYGLANGTWSDSGTPVGATLTLNVDANSQTINVETVFAEDTPGLVASGTLEWRQPGTSQVHAWSRPMHALRPSTVTFPSAWNQLIGKILLFDGYQGKQVQVRASYVVNGATVKRVATVTIRSEPASAYAAAATRYVSMTGTDSGAGGSGAPWRSLEYARSHCSANDVVEVGPGSYACPTQAAWPAGVTVRAQTAAKSADNAKTVIAAGLRTIIEPRGSDGWPAISAPTGATDADLTSRTPDRIAPWTKVTLTGPGLHTVPVADRVCWKWASSPVADVSTIAYHTTRTGDLTHVNVRARVGTGSLTTAAGWLEAHHTNLQYSDADGANSLYADGCWSDGSNNVYLKVPGIADETHDPNAYYWTVGGQSAVATGINLDGAGQAVAGFDLRGLIAGVGVAYPAADYLIERCTFQNVVFGVSQGGTHNNWLTTGVASQYPTRGLVRYCWDRQTGLWSLDQATKRTVSWNDVKSSTQYVDGTTDARSNGAYQERKFIGNTNGWKNLEVHDCVTDGVWDFANSFHDKSDQFAGWGSDFWNLTVNGCADDAFDLSRWGGAQACWSSRFEGGLTTIGMAPYWGTFLMFDVVSWGNTQRGSGKKNDGTSSPISTFWKYSDGSGGPSGRIDLINVSQWSDRGGTSALTDTVYGANPAGGGAVGSSGIPDIYMRNTLIRGTICTGRFIQAVGHMDIDYCELHDTGTNTGSLRQGLHPEAHTPGTIRTAANLTSLQGTYPAEFGVHINLLNPITIATSELDAALIDPANGNLTPSGALLGAGTILSGLHTTTPDIGAISRRVS